MIPEQRLLRVFAHLLRNEGVEPAAIERAVESARHKRLGEHTTLTGDVPQDATLRRVFCMEQVDRLWKAD